MFFSAKMKGHHHLQGNVQVYNVRIPVFLYFILKKTGCSFKKTPTWQSRFRRCRRPDADLVTSRPDNGSIRGLKDKSQAVYQVGCFFFFFLDCYWVGSLDFNFLVEIQRFSH